MTLLRFAIAALSILVVGRGLTSMVLFSFVFKKVFDEKLPSKWPRIDLWAVAELVRVRSLKSHDFSYPDINAGPLRHASRVLHVMFASSRLP